MLFGPSVQNNNLTNCLYEAGNKKEEQKTPILFLFVRLKSSDIAFPCHTMLAIFTQIYCIVGWVFQAEGDEYPGFARHSYEAVNPHKLRRTSTNARVPPH